jgi:asparagine synthase (glutamine-hydrolysing)
MCGIAAIVCRSGGRQPLGDIDGLLSALRHRGSQPPMSRLYAGAALGCVRLDIVDSVGGVQPMEAGPLAIAYNGEIYNHAELRAALIAEGVAFDTRSDTEVVLKGYGHWGEAILDRLEGMFAFVIHDQRSGGFFAARDPFGIKPLYVVAAEDTWWFSSEIRALRGLPAEPRPVPAGGHLSEAVACGRARYEEINPVPTAVAPLAATIDAFREAFSASVERHIPPDDLPVAVFCSGGVDSSAILYEAVQACRRRGWDPTRKLRVYSVGTSASEDPKVAARLTQELGLDFVFQEIDVPTMVAAIPEAVRVMETFEPNHIRAGTTSIALSKRVAADGFKVALLGEGADELLGGYQEFPEAARTGGAAAVEDLIRIFSRQLHRTQLRRVDRTSMSATLEARVPFLDRKLTRLINTIPTDYKVRRVGNGEFVGKYVLREAYRGLMPDYIVDRRKVPMGEGAGVGDNRPAGPFHAHAEASVSEAELQQLSAAYPQYRISTKEEALYLGVFLREFGPLALAADRPRTNALQTR